MGKHILAGLAEHLKRVNNKLNITQDWDFCVVFWLQNFFHFWLTLWMHYQVYDLNNSGETPSCGMSQRVMILLKKSNFGIKKCCQVAF